MVQYNAISFFFFSLSPCIPLCLCAAACLERQSQRAPQRAVSACAPAPVNLRRSDIVFWMLNWMRASRLICIRCANTLDDVLIHGTTNKPFRAFPCEARSAPPPPPCTLHPSPLSCLLPSPGSLSGHWTTKSLHAQQEEKPFAFSSSLALLSLIRRSLSSLFNE